MKPDWDELGEKYENSKKVLIGDVDCTLEDSKKLCEEQGVTGYPTIKYYNPGDREGTVYEGDRSLEGLKKFVKTLGPACGPSHRSRCTAEQVAELDGYLAMGASDLQAKAAAMQQTLDDATSTHDALLKSLQAQFEESDKALKALKEESTPAIKLMKAAIANLTAAEEASTEKKEEL